MARKSKGAVIEITTPKANFGVSRTFIDLGFKEIPGFMLILLLGVFIFGVLF
jgi:hypothetical protein